MTKVEHNKIEKIKKDEGNLKETKSQIYELDWKSGLFQSGNVAGFLFAKKYEGDFFKGMFSPIEFQTLFW